MAILNVSMLRSKRKDYADDDLCVDTVALPLMKRLHVRDSPTSPPSFDGLDLSSTSPTSHAGASAWPQHHQHQQRYQQQPSAGGAATTTSPTRARRRPSDCLTESDDSYEACLQSLSPDSKRVHQWGSVIVEEPGDALTEVRDPYNYRMPRIDDGEYVYYADSHPPGGASSSAATSSSSSSAWPWSRSRSRWPAAGPSTSADDDDQDAERDSGYYGGRGSVEICEVTLSKEAESLLQHPTPSVPRSILDSWARSQHAAEEDTSKALVVYRPLVFDTEQKQFIVHPHEVITIEEQTDAMEAAMDELEL